MNDFIILAFCSFLFKTAEWTEKTNEIKFKYSQLLTNKKSKLVSFLFY
jgi:hypothetical protein